MLFKWINFIDTVIKLQLNKSLINPVKAMEEESKELA